MSLQMLLHPTFNIHAVPTQRHFIIYDTLFANLYHFTYLLSFSAFVQTTLYAAAVCNTRVMGEFSVLLLLLLMLSLSLSPRFNGHSPGEPGLASVY